VGRSRRALGALAGIGGAVAAWSLFESQWVECRTVHVAVRGLPRALDGLSILHLSDLHLGSPSLNARALRKAVDFGVRENADIVAITGDIINTPAAEPAVVAELSRLTPRFGTYAVLGNHDVGRTKDPMSQGRVITDWRDAHVRLLRDQSEAFEVNGHPVEIAGIDPATWIAERRAPRGLFSERDAFRILLAHYPDVIDDLPAGWCSLVLSGHLHGGQLTFGLPGVGKLRMPHERWTYAEGVHDVGGTTLVVSRGVGTTLLPARLMSRPEAAVLRLQASEPA
jgi:predicted MPP superfamily phosphohydrolase